MALITEPESLFASRLQVPNAFDFVINNAFQNVHLSPFTWIVYTGSYATHATVLLSDTKICVRIEMSPGLSATCMLLSWLLLRKPPTRTLYRLLARRCSVNKLLLGTTSSSVMSHYQHHLNLRLKQSSSCGTSLPPIPGKYGRYDKSSLYTPPDVNSL